MKRRGFIKSGMVTLVAGTTGPAALGEIIAPDGENITSEEMDHFLVDMDVAMDRISSSSGHYLNNLMNQQPKDIDLVNFRAGLRSMLLVGNFGDLSIKGQVHPGMQRRMLYSATEINSTLMESTNFLKSMTPVSRTEIKFAFHDEPDLGDRILDSLELEAKSIGVPTRRQRQMRRMGSRIIKRLKHSPDMLINEYLSKCEKLNSIDDSEIDSELFLKKQMGDTEYKTRFQKAENAALQWQKSGLPEIPIGYKPIKVPDEDEKPSLEKKDNRYREGKRALGIGAIVTSVGWLLIAITGGWAGIILGITVGPLIILIALIMLLAQASKKSQE